MVEDVLVAGLDVAGGAWNSGRQDKPAGAAGGPDERQQRVASARRAASASSSAMDWPARWASTSGNWRARS
jgi:hypothetical protein